MPEIDMNDPEDLIYNLTIGERYAFFRPKPISLFHAPYGEPVYGTFDGYSGQGVPSMEELNKEPLKERHKWLKNATVNLTDIDDIEVKPPRDGRRKIPIGSFVWVKHVYVPKKSFGGRRRTRRNKNKKQSRKSRLR